MIFTFYSYKGGVGRSMALANVAEWFYLQGARVVVVDWDLEAPGIETFFYETQSDLEEVRAKPGLIDLLLNYRDHYAAASRKSDFGEPKEIHRAAISKMNIEDWLHPIHAPDPLAGSRPRGLWLLPAGLRHGRFAEYAESVHDFDWAEFYADYEGEAFFGWLRRQVAPEFEGVQLMSQGLADVVLIDSRTGITEMGGVCTQELADVVVAFAATNLQNLMGLASMARSFQRKEIRDSRGGKPEVIFVPSRVDASELESRNRFERRLRDLEPEFIPPILQSLKRSFWDLKIPYVPRFAYEEALTIRNEASKGRYIEAQEMVYAYRALAATMAMLTPATHAMRSYLMQDTASLFEKKRVYLIWAGGNSLANAACLRLQSEAPDLNVWSSKRDDDAPEPDTDISEAAAASSSLLLAISPDTLDI